jgi:integrase
MASKNIAKRTTERLDPATGKTVQRIVWRARYRDAAGKEHARHFPTKRRAETWLDEVTAAVVTGQYVDPRAGRVTFRTAAEQWRAAQVHRPSTRAHVETMLRRHAYPTLGDRELASILPSDVQAWVAGLSLAPSTVAVVHGLVSAVMRSAVLDRRIVSNPCDATRLPKATQRRVTPMPLDVLERIVAAAPDSIRAAVTLAASTGMRQGEVLGLTVDRVDFLRRTVTIDRALVTVAGEAPFLAPPKTASSVRVIPLPQVAVDALAAHLRDSGPTEASVLWRTPERTTTVEAAFMFGDDGRPWSRQQFGRAWHRATRAASDCARHRPKGRDLKASCTCLAVDFHELRHLYASLLIRHGESVKTVQARLGHKDAAETLNTYSHLWPDSDDRTREAIDTALGAPALADSLRTREVT